MGGDSTGHSAWLLGYVRKDGAITEPQDGQVSCAEGTPAPLADLAWDCSSHAPIPGRDRFVAVRTENYFLRALGDAKATCRYWQPEKSANPLQHVACCN